MSEMIQIGADFGASSIKLRTLQGGSLTLSQIALNGSQHVAQMLGLRSRKPPLQVSTAGGSFYVGRDAHDWGRLVENLDYERLTGTPEMGALFCASLTNHMRKHGPFTAPLSVTVGLPLEPITGEPELVAANVEAVRKWVKGTHTWKADGQDYQVEVAEAKITSQPVGALFDYLLNDEGQFIPARKGHFKKEIGIVSIGFNTIELMGVRDRAPIQNFTAGTTSGVRRLLEIVNAGNMYSLGELDAQLRIGQVDVSGALPVWGREVTGFMEKKWGKSWQRFVAVLVVGGGAILLKDALAQRFNGKAIVPDDPVMSIARGLYKLSLLNARKRRKSSAENEENDGGA